MDKLLATIAEARHEDDVLIRFIGAAWSGTAIRLQLAVSVITSASTSEDWEVSSWEVSCEDVLAYILCDQGAFSLELTNDHPVLWEFKGESASAFFYGAPTNADAAVGSLYEAHQNAVGVWIQFGKHLNTAPGLTKLLTAGNGLLAAGPVPLLNVYKEALRSHGVSVDIRFAHQPRTWDGNQWRQLEQENNMKALLLGNSYVIGAGWASQQTS